MKKYMVFIISFVCVFALAGCGSEAANEDLKTDAGEIYEWVNFLDGKEMPWNESIDLIITEYPDTTFRWTPYKVTAIADEKEKTLFEGMPIWNIYLADLNGDHLSEFCATVSFGSGIIDNRIIVYDYTAQEAYELSDRGTFDYNLAIRDNQLTVIKSNYNGTEIATGTLIFNTTEEGSKTTTLAMEIH